PHVYLSDVTTEAIAVRLDQQPRGLPVILDELGILFGSMNQYKSGKGSDLETFLAFYDAGAAKIDRKAATPPVIFIPRAFIAITGMIQPGVLSKYLGPREFASGLAARFIFAAPPPIQAKWRSNGVAQAAHSGWHHLLATLLARPTQEQPIL